MFNSSRNEEGGKKHITALILASEVLFLKKRQRRTQMGFNPDRIANQRRLRQKKHGEVHLSALFIIAVWSQMR